MKIISGAKVLPCAPPRQPQVRAGRARRRAGGRVGMLQRGPARHLQAARAPGDAPGTQAKTCARLAQIIFCVFEFFLDFEKKLWGVVLGLVLRRRRRHCCVLAFLSFLFLSCLLACCGDLFAGVLSYFSCPSLFPFRFLFLFLLSFFFFRFLSAPTDNDNNKMLLRRLAAAGAAMAGALGMAHAAASADPATTPPPPLPPLPPRAEQLARAQAGVAVDLLVIGGGATGCGVALDAATRGLSTVLVEQDDFSAGTSSRSTKLIHGPVKA